MAINIIFFARDLGRSFLFEEEILIYDLIDNLEEELRKKKLRDNTIRCYKSAFHNFIKDINYNDEKIVLDKLNKVKNKTELSQIINSIRTLKDLNYSFDFLDEEKLKSIIKNKENNKHKNYEPYELKDALRKINALRNDKYKLAYRLMTVSGLRVFEISNLTKNNIRFENDKIIISVIDGKGGKNAEVECLEDKYLNEKLKKFLEGKSSEEKVFYSKSILQEKAKKLNFKCHDLRRAYSKLVKKKLLNELVEVEEDKKEKIIEEEVKTALRHSKFETSKKYLYSKRIKV